MPSHGWTENRILYWRSQTDSSDLSDGSYTDHRWYHDFYDPGSDTPDTPPPYYSNSNWCRADGTPAWAPMDGDTVIIGPLTYPLREPDGDPGDGSSEAWLDALQNPYDYYWWTSEGGHKGRCAQINDWHYRNGTYDAEPYDYYFAGRYRLAELVVTESFDGGIGYKREDDDNGDFTKIIYNPMPLNAEKVIFKAPCDAYFRASGRATGLEWDSDEGQWLDTGNSHESVTIPLLIIDNPDAHVYLSSQRNDGDYESIWEKVILINGSVTILKQESELGNLPPDSRDYLGEPRTDDSYTHKPWDSDAGTIVNIIICHNGNAVIKSECRSKVTYRAIDIENYGAKIICESHLRNLIMKGGNLNVGHNAMSEWLASNNIALSEMKLFGGIVDFRGAGQLSNGSIYGGKFLCRGSSRQQIGNFTIYNGVLDLREHSGYIDIAGTVIRRGDGIFHKKKEHTFIYS